ncbi:unnamed protein product, partial [Closterium sp. NIES-53]
DETAAMSGGFFRGTSADQDSRFSNKNAKLLKSQKFAPELDEPVDMTKVKKDVMQPWIGKRVTELLGVEDEVLINFIYSLLDGKLRHLHGSDHCPDPPWHQGCNGRRKPAMAGGLALCQPCQFRLKVDGKQVQIQLTGFMERHTARFMRELWCLLLSAQANVSGIPQKFLDEKAEETRKKKEAEQRILSEIGRKKGLQQQGSLLGPGSAAASIP